MTDEYAWKIFGNILIVASPLAFVAAVVYMILRDLLRKDNDDDKETDEANIDPLDSEPPDSVFRE